MTTDYRVLNPKRIPKKLPVTFTLVIILYIREYELSDLRYWIVVSFLILLWLYGISMKIIEDYRDPFNNG